MFMLYMLIKHPYQLMPLRAGALVAIAFVHNLLRRHPACGVLLHRPPRPSPSAASPNPDPDPAASAPAQDGTGPRTAAEEAGVDVYVEEATDPALSRALENSLWEVDSLRNHYCPQARPAVWFQKQCLKLAAPNNKLNACRCTGAWSKQAGVTFGRLS